MTKSPLPLGTLAEDYACKQLQQKGYRLISRNYRCRYGEIDIIAVDKETLVFVEVKARSGFRYGTPLEAVSLKKIVKISQVGEHFAINSQQLLPQAHRIDVAAIMLVNNQLVMNLFVGVDK